LHAAQETEAEKEPAVLDKTADTEKLISEWNPPPTPEQTDAEAKAAEFSFINLSGWRFDNVPAREWAVPDRIPLRQVNLFTGEGAAGKSTVKLHLCCAHVLARDWLGTMPAPGPAFFIDAEDDEKELHRRLTAILNHYRVTFEEAVAGGLYLRSLAGEDAVLASTTKGGIVQPTELYKGLLERAGDLKPKMIAIASAANVFAGNEIIRPEVQQFIGLLTRVAIAANGAVSLIAHPSLTGISSDSGLSGSTQWHNSVRSRMWLKGVKADPGEQQDSDLRELVFKKNNYGPISSSVVLRYERGLFLPMAGVSSLDMAAFEARAEDVFLAILRKLIERGTDPSPAPSSPSYAPTLVGREPEAKGIRKDAIAAAMNRIFERNRIHIEVIGRKGHEKKVLRVGPKP
jgi:RecA-family ATPase